MPSPVIIEGCADYSPKHCADAVAALVRFFPLLQTLQPGTRVAVKVNLVTMMHPEKAATTHPALLAALTEYLQSRGAQVTIGDAPGGTYTKTYLDGVYTATGMKQTGAALNQNFAVKHADYPAGAVLKDFDYTAWLDEADLIINFCKLKTHGMMGMSCAVKNLFGVIPGLTKPAYHYRFPDEGQFADMLVDLNEYFHPALHIVDAVVGMEGNGPTMGKPRHIGAVLASEDPYALDLICAKLIGLGPGQVPTLQAAARRGLAPQAVEAVPLQGELVPFLQRDFDTSGAGCGIEEFLGGQGFLPKLGNRFAHAVLAVRPRLSRGDCVGCGKCAGLCPAKAITMRRGRPSIDRKACIRCFCCQEFCPVGAMKARRSAMGDFLLRHTQH